MQFKAIDTSDTSGQTYNQSLVANLVDAITGQVVTSATLSFVFVAQTIINPTLSFTPASSVSVQSNTPITFSVSAKGSSNYTIRYSVSGGASSDVITYSPSQNTNQFYGPSGYSGTESITINRGSSISPVNQPYTITANMYDQNNNIVASVSQPVTVSITPPTPTYSLEASITPSNGQISNNSNVYVSVSYTYSGVTNPNLSVTITSENNVFPTYTTTQNLYNNPIDKPFLYNIVSLEYPSTYSDTITVSLLLNGSVIQTKNFSVLVTAPQPAPVDPLLQIFNNAASSPLSVTATYIPPAGMPCAGQRISTTWTFTIKSYSSNGIVLNIQSQLWVDPSLNGGSSADFTIGSGGSQSVSLAVGVDCFLTLGQQNNLVQFIFENVYSSNSG